LQARGHDVSKGAALFKVSLIGSTAHPSIGGLFDTRSKTRRAQRYVRSWRKLTLHCRLAHRKLEDRSTTTVASSNRSLFTCGTATRRIGATA
jgi:hypothetical protein